MAGTRTVRAVRDQVLDLDVVARELARVKAEVERVKAEIAVVPEGLRKKHRAKLLQESMARLALVKRFIESVLEANGWEEEDDADDS